VYQNVHCTKCAAILPNSDREQACKNNFHGQTSKNTSQNNWHFGTIDEIPSVPSVARKRHTDNVQNYFIY